MQGHRRLAEVEPEVDAAAVGVGCFMIFRFGVGDDVVRWVVVKVRVGFGCCDGGNMSDVVAVSKTADDVLLLERGGCKYVDAVKYAILVDETKDCEKIEDFIALIDVFRMVVGVFGATIRSVCDDVKGCPVSTKLDRCVVSAVVNFPDVVFVDHVKDGVD